VVLFLKDIPVGDPVPRAQSAIREIQAATEACAQVRKDYSAGRATATEVYRCDMRLAKGHRHLYDCESGRADDHRN
jgi:hypothetical protein